MSVAVGDVQHRIALLDANLLILWISIRLGFNEVSNFKRVKIFTAEDADLLVWLLSQFKGVATTAYVLAEASNLANELTGQLRERWFSELAAFAVVTEEAHVPTALVGKQPEAVRFGMADAALSYLSNDYTLITTEYRLSGYLVDRGKNVINFGYLQVANLDL